MSRPEPIPVPLPASAVAVARQPILDRHQRVFGYALMFGPPPGHDVRTPQPDVVSPLIVAEALAHPSFRAVTGGRRAFLPVTRQTLLDGLPARLPTENVVIELSADIEGDTEVLEACRNLRHRGYSIAIDDFVLNPWTAGLLPYATYLKVDARRPTSPDERARSVACLKPGVAAVIATHVETFTEFEAAAHDGFTYFQGFFFGRPLIVPGRDVAGHHLQTLRLLRALNDPNLSIGELEDLVSHDAALCYRILRTVNSAGFGLRWTVQSMHDALLLLGRDAVRRWASLWAVAGLGEQSPSELVIMATVRARCCELLASSTRAPVATGDAFLLGMCSLLDTMLDRPMTAIVAELPLEDDTKRALCGEQNPKRIILDCTIAYERGEWSECSRLARIAGIDPAVLPGASAEAMRWAQELREPMAARGRQ